MEITNNYNVPRIGFVNKMDRQGKFQMSVPSKGNVRVSVLPLQIPIGAEESFEGVVDLINFKGIVWNEEDQGMTFKEVEIPQDIIRRKRI